MDFKKVAVLLLLPLALAACDSGQPTYSAANANSAPPPPPPQAEPQAPPPVAQAPVVQPPAAPPTAPPRQDLPKPPTHDSASRFAQVPAGKIGPVPKLGVGSCDDYIERYRECFNSTTIAHEDKFPLRRALAQQVRQWKADAQAGKISQVAAACSDADKKARIEFGKVGCKAF